VDFCKRYPPQKKGSLGLTAKKLGAIYRPAGKKMGKKYADVPEKKGPKKIDS